jgi:uncharacterized protein (TIGR02145 family)
MFTQYFRYAILALVIAIQAGTAPFGWGQALTLKSTPTQDKRVPAGQSQEVEVAVSSGILQWQQSDDGITWFNWTGHTVSRVSVVVDQEVFLRCAITESNCDPVYSDVVRLIPIYLPQLTTRTVTEIQAATASSGGLILSDGNDPIQSKGICWSTLQNPDISGHKTEDGAGSADFFSLLTGLNPGAVYYVRAYATNGVGTAYGNELSFTTLINATNPTVSTGAVTGIAQHTAVCGGNVSDQGSSAVIARGVCFGTSANPTLAGAKTTNGSGTGAFTSNLSGLSPNTTFHVRAYATNSEGTAYGEDITFTTLINAVLPTVTTYAVSGITQTTATGGGNVTNQGSSPVTARGVCFSTSANPTLADGITTDGTGTGVFMSSLTGLNDNTTYYVRAYATNGEGTAYGTERTFKTLVTPTLPTVTTTAATSITNTSVTTGGNVTSEGSSPVVLRGVCWSGSPNPTKNDIITADGAGPGAYVSNITTLVANFTYYIRAYATSVVGTAYGEEIVVVTTGTGTPLTVITAAVTGISQTGATCGGNVTHPGSSVVLTRGVCWSTSANPTIADLKTTDGSSLGSYTSSITGLSANTAYHVRAYATNSQTTAYGEDIPFTTLPNASLPVLTTVAISNIGQTTASSGGSISSAGSGTVTARGVCWSTSRNPGVRDDRTSDGMGTGNFRSEISGLTPGTPYYVRAYATNSTGTGYGNELTFTTGTSGLPVVTTTVASDITAYGAKTGGNVTSQGSTSVTERGVCYGTTPDPDISGFHIISGSGTGSFISILPRLVSGRLYYVRAYATNRSGTAYGNQISFTTLAVPTVTTAAVTNIEPWSVTAGGNVTAQGSSAVTARGVCWGTAANPDLSDSFFTQGSGLGSYTVNVTGLKQNTVYHVRAFATNAVGTDYGSDVTFTTEALTVMDGDGNVYNTVKIGNQIWTAENLKTTKYVNGSDMINLTDNAAWATTGSPAYCWYNNDISNKDKYGALYNWEAVRSGKLEPEGWHIPTEAEVETLLNYLGGYDLAGGKLKETGTTYWTEPNTGATNETGFSGRPGGRRAETGAFQLAAYFGYIWTTTPFDPYSYFLYLQYGSSNAHVTATWPASGLSIRLIKD